MNQDIINNYTNNMEKNLILTKELSEKLTKTWKNLLSCFKSFNTDVDSGENDNSKLEELKNAFEKYDEVILEVLMCDHKKAAEEKNKDEFLKSINRKYMEYHKTMDEANIAYENTDKMYSAYNTGYQNGYMEGIKFSAENLKLYADGLLNAVIDE